MSEPFDVEISRALKESAGKSLEGWEFTPAMRSRVMDAIRAEAREEAAPVSPPSRRFGRFVRPAAWVAVAAAAMVIAMNTDLSSLGGFGAAKKEAPAESKTTASAPKGAGPSGTAPAQDTAQASGPSNKKAAEPKAAAATQNVTTATAVAPPAEPQPARRLAFELTAPPAAESAPAQTLMAPRSKMSLAAAAVSNLSGAVSHGGAVLTLTPLGIKALDGANVTVWERPLADLTPQSVMAVAADGRVAVANGADLVYLVNDRGDLDRTIQAGAPVAQLVWSHDGRVAALEGDKVVVYGAETGKAQFTVDAGPNSEAVFTPDGLLATYGEQLTLADAGGRVTARLRLTGAGRGLAVAAEGRVLVAGGQAFDCAGKPLWELPLRTEGLAAVGRDRLVAWDAHTVLAVSVRGGLQELWKADWKGAGPGITRVVPSPDGRFVVIVAQVDDGAILWAVGADGRPLLTEKLPQMPVNISVAGNQVILIQANTVEYRTVAE